MSSEEIRKSATFAKTANLRDYDATYRSFRWADVMGELDGLPGYRLNIAHEALDRHTRDGKRDKVALRWLSKEGRPRDFTYGELSALTNRFANLLRGLELKKGARVFVLAGRIPELYITALGCWKAGCVFAPLFSAFGPEPIRQRLTLGDGELLVTTERLYQRKVEGIRQSLPKLRHVLLVGADRLSSTPPETESFHRLLDRADDDFAVEPTDPNDMAIVHFTSGTTGTPKGAVHVHRAVQAHYHSARYALDLHPDDVFWCTADPGWVTGTSYGIIAPLICGATNVVDEGEFDAERWYRILQAQRVNVWYTAPTAIRMLMKVGSGILRRFDLSALRFVASVGEPLNPEGVVWGQEAFGMPIHDNWWQTETGSIMIANYAAMPVRPGSMGRPLPGIEVAILRRDKSGALAMRGAEPLLVEQPDVEGELALRTGWPSMFRGYLQMERRYRAAFAGSWYRTGDLARRDADGYFWFVGRADDVIKSAGHLIGPFEVESTLVAHPAVAEAGVIGKPDPVAGEIVKAFVALKNGYAASDALSRDLLGFARKRLGAAVAPREIEIRDSLPKTRSGKIMRRLLKAWELGLPTGDISTLDADYEESVETTVAGKD